jgi:NodT family efflux transporter outer membrane factor (OMF) lipoprotein
MRRFTMYRLGLAATPLLFLSACKMGPNYSRPAASVPPQYRYSPPTTGTPPSLADTKWADIFQDEVLTDLVNTALKQNFDLKIATERVLEARAQYGISRSQLFPQLDATANVTSARSSTIGGVLEIPRDFNYSFTYSQVGFSLNWELDVWGRLRRLTESARAEYLASEEGRRAVITTFVADVISNYLQLRELDLELEIGKQNEQIAKDGLRLTTLRRARGVATGLDVHQAEQFLYTATAQIAATERSIGETEDALSLLLGQSPGSIPRGKKLEEFVVPSSLPPGLPSSLLERRPDIREAEQTLAAANAEIGAAKAEYFPQITLTSFLGVQSRALSSLFTGPGRQWSFVPEATQPIFNAGRIRNKVRLTEAQEREALQAYEKAIQSAFREVSDALISFEKSSQQRSQEQLLVQALRDTDRLSRLRYKGGLDSFLQVLDAERNLFQGELTLAQLRNQELSSIVLLYRALGGGWQ